MRSRRTRALVLGLNTLLPVTALAQAPLPASVTASRSAEISAFTEVSRLSADFCPCTNTGVVFGAAYTRFSRRLLSPSLEVRGSLAPGPQVNENTLVTGLRLQTDFGRLRPFANFLVGGGAIRFTHPFVYPDGTVYSHDSSTVFQYGGGLQYTVTRSWAAQAEVQAQHWNLGSIPPVTFAPMAVNFGVTYRIPFRPYRGD